MDFVSFAIIFFMGLALLIILLLPILIGIPFYKLIMIKLRRSMLVLMLNPSKRLEAKEAETKSSIITTKRGNFNFLNVPDAVYHLWGIPIAIAYHKYGAILPFQNIVHATEMREMGFKNIGEVNLALHQLHNILYGDKENEGLVDMQGKLIAKVSALEANLNTFLFNISEEMLKTSIKSDHFPQELRKQFKAAGYNLGVKKPEIKQLDETTWALKSNPDSFVISKEEVVNEDDGENTNTITKIAVYRNIPEPDKEKKQHEYEAAKTQLSQLNEQINELAPQLSALEETKIEESGVIKIQDIFNFLNKNLSTDVLFSIIERNVAEELQDVRDHFGKFQQMLPTIITLIIVFTIAYLIVTGGGGGGGASGIGESITNIIPKIGAP